MPVRGAYDDLNRLTNIDTVNTATTTTIQSHLYTLGSAGNRESVLENDGTARSYTYDELYRLTGETVNDGIADVFVKTFTYDDVGSRLNQTTVGTGTTDLDYNYDTRDRLETEAGITYTYDDNGNVLTKSAEATYIWDIENCLVEIQKTDGTVIQHDYDPDGNRVQTITTPSGGPAEVQNFLVDTSGSLSHVVVETDGAGLVAQYVRGDGELLAVIRSGGSRFFHADGLGSIRRLTDEAGVITDGYTYTAFGELTSHTGTDTQPYAFTGEPLDLNTGLQYHRARWMDPRVGRFAGMDPFGGRASEPATLHKYLYASVHRQWSCRRGVERRNEFLALAWSTPRSRTVSDSRRRYTHQHGGHILSSGGVAHEVR